MEREEKEERKGELMVEKLKRGILVGKREGISTPSPTWKFGLIQPDGTLIPELNLSANPNTLSARKLGANLWEMEAQLNLRVANFSRNDPIFSHQKSKEKEASGIPRSSSKQETSGIKLRKQPAASKAQHSTRVEKDGLAQQPLSPASSMEMAPNRYAISPSSSLVSSYGKFGESSQRLKTSTELLKVLNRIWSLEEKHALDMSLVKTLRKELDQSEARIQELVHEKKRDQNVIGDLMKQIKEYKGARKKEQQQVNDAVKLVEEKLENELKIRRHSEKHGKELLEMKSSLERERKARVLLEDLCDEFAKGIRDYEQEARLLRQKSGGDQIGRDGNDRCILHISEAWLDVRTQMKLADSHDVVDKQSGLDKLCIEIESLLREKGSGNSAKNQDMSYKSNVPSHSLESFHLNEPASAPWNAKDEDDSVGVTTHCPQLCRVCSLKQGQQGEITSGGHDKETTKSRTETPRKGAVMQMSSREGKDRVSFDGCFDPSTFAGPLSPVKKWTSEVSGVGPDTTESSSRREKPTKPNTLRQKLMEARLEGQQSRTRTSRSLSRVE